MPNHFHTSFHSLLEHQQLIQNSATSIIQDDQGFLWIGTLGGLHRFDGQKMLFINDMVLDGSSLEVIRVLSLYKGQKGDIWVVGTFGSLDLLNTVNGRVEHFSDLTQRNGNIGLKLIHNVVPLDDGAALIGDRSSIYRIDRTRHTIEKLSIFWPDDFQEFLIQDFLLLDDGKILLTTRTHVGILDLESGQVNFLQLDKKWFSKDVALKGITRLNNGSIWIFGDHSALFRLIDSGSSFYLRKVILPTEMNFEIMDLAMTLGGTFWFHLESKGMAIWNPISDQFRLVDIGLRQATDRQRNILRCFFVDRSGVVWIGTDGFGLRYSDPSRDRFSHLRGEDYYQDGFADPYLWRICEDSEGIIVMGRRELVRFDPESGETKQILDILTHPEMVGLLELSTFLPLGDGEWLLGFRSGMVGVFNQHDNSFQPLEQYFDLLENPNSPPIVRQFEIDRAGQIWVFSSGSTLVYNPIANNFSHPATKLDHALGKSEVRVMLEDKGGTYWFGTENSGLIHYDPHRDRIEVWRDYAKPGDLANPGVRAIYEGGNGDIWIGTYNGLNVLRVAERQKGGRHLELYTVHDGLPNNTIYSILPGDGTELWFSTNQGLCRFREKSGTWRNFKRSDGLANNEFNGGAQLRSKSGHLLFGGIEGLTWFKPGQQMENLIAPQVSLTKIFNIGSEPFVFLGIPSLQHVSLPWHSNRLEFELVSLDFQQPGDHQVAYRIDGVDDQWRVVSAGQHIDISNLPSGSLILHYRGANNDGVWSDERKLIIEVGIPPWRTGRAFLAYGLAMILLISLIGWNSRRRWLRNEEIKQQEIITDKLRAVGLLAGGLAHDFGNLLQVLMAHSDMARRRVHAGHPAEQSLEKLVLAGEKAQLMVKRLLALSTDEEPLWEVVDLDKVVLEMNPMLTSLVGKEISLEYDFGPDEKIIRADKDQLEQVMNNLCLNARDAIEGTGCIVIKTRCVAEKQYCVLSVADDGKGISSQDVSQIFEPFYSNKNSGKGTGLGLAIVYNIVEIHHGKVFVRSTPGLGTVFDVQFPLAVISPKEATFED